MKQFFKKFLLRGLICAAGGPLVLAIIYGVLDAAGAVETVAPKEVCLAIITVTLLAFIAAGMTAIYHAEHLPLATMILLHGSALYIAYILTYLINGWLANSLIPILIFTGFFILGYTIIWGVIYFVERAKTAKLNQLLQN